jgi:hypothetical protein
MSNQAQPSAKIQELCDADGMFAERYQEAKQAGIQDAEILLYERTGGVSQHLRSGLAIRGEAHYNANGKIYWAVRITDRTRKQAAGKHPPSRTITLPNKRERNKSWMQRIPLYHEICVRQMSANGGQP